MREKIKETMKSIFELETIDNAISQNNCDKWDSLHFLRLIVDLEELFDIEFEPEDMMDMNSLDNIELKIKMLLDHNIKN